MRKTWILVGMFTLVACDSPSDAEGPEERTELGKADNIGSCEDSSCDGPSPSGKCFCDDLCDTFGDCCTDKGVICGGVACESLGGECLSQAGDPGFPALCESELGRETLVGGECPAINEACCGAPIEAPSCASLGGECLSQPGDPGFPALCESDLGRATLEGTCDAFNEACCGQPL
jgi:hypothetical protein